MCDLSAMSGANDEIPPTSLFQTRQKEEEEEENKKLCCGLLNLTSSYFSFSGNELKSHFSDQEILLINLLATDAHAAAPAAATSRIRHAKYSATTITKEHFYSRHYSVYTVCK